MTKEPLVCYCCGQHVSRVDNYDVVLYFPRAPRMKLTIYNREKTITHSFFGLGRFYLQVGIINLCKNCRQNLSSYFLTRVGCGFGLEINRLLIDESKEASVKVVSVFGRWVLEFFKNRIRGLYSHDWGLKIAGISLESLCDIFAGHEIKSKLVLQALNELVEEQFLTKTTEAEKTIFWGPVRKERVRIYLHASSLLCADEKAHFALMCSHGGFVRISLFKRRKKISERDIEVAAKKKQTIDIRFPNPGDYRLHARYLRVKEARIGSVPGLMLKTTEAIQKLDAKVRSKGPPLDVENPFIDVVYPAKLKFSTEKGATVENISVNIDGTTLGKKRVRKLRNKFEVTLRGKIEPTPKVHLLSLRKIANGEISCPTVVQFVGFKIEKPENFGIGKKHRIKILFPKMKHIRIKLEVGWKDQANFVGDIFHIPQNGRLELETPMLKGKDRLALKLQDPLRPEKQAGFLYPIKVEPIGIKAECKPTTVGSDFAVKITGPAFFLNKIKTQIVHESSKLVKVTTKRISVNSILLKGIADISGRYLIDLQSSIPFKIEGDKGFSARTAPTLVADKREYNKNDEQKLKLLYDPIMNIETIEANISYYNYFTKSQKSIRFNKTGPGTAEAIINELPPCTAEVSVKVIYKEGSKDLIKKIIDIYGTNLLEIEK